MRDSFGKAGTGREMPCSKAIVDANPCSTENPTDSSMPMESDETSETCQQVHAHCCPARCRRSRGSDKAAADLPAGVSQTAVPGAHQSCANPQGLADLETEPEEEFDLPSDDIFAEAEDDDVFNEEIVYDTVFNPPVCGSEKGSSDQRGKRTSTKTKSIVYDTRTEELMVKPGNAVDWSLDIDLATRLPTAFAHTLKKKAVKRAGAQRAYAAAAAGSKQDLKREFLYDCGCEITQVPEALRGLLDDVHTIPPVYLDTAGLEDPVITEQGTLRFLLEGVATPIEVRCHINPHNGTPLLSLDTLERLDRGKIMSQLWNDVIDFKGTLVPLIRRGKSPFIRLTILSGDAESRARLNFTTPRAQPKAQPARVVNAATEPFEYVHRMCAHANPECCRRTADKAKGLPSLKRCGPSHRPCPECSLSKTKAPAKGQGNLSTGHVATRPGQVFCGDVFGPLQVPGLAGERYFIILVCQFSKWGVTRAFTRLSQVPDMIDEMLAEIKATLNAVPTHIEFNSFEARTVHSDNASVFKSEEHKARMRKLGIHLTFSAPYEPRTNPYAERFGGILMGLTRANLLEGCFPPRFWSVIIRTTCWTMNRLVRPSGFAPIEVFAGQTIDFSKAHLPGVLAYWHIEKKQRDDPKLGSAAAVGVYLGPAEAFGSRGHLVYTANEKLRAVSHVMVDNDTKPFQLGMLKVLMTKSYEVTAVHDRAQVDPNAFVLPGGDLAFDYVGQRTRKLFPDGLWYEGVVQRVIPPQDDDGADAEIWFHTMYSDGDAEDYTFAELKQVLVQKGKEPACAAASRDATRDMDTDWLFPEPDAALEKTLLGYEDLIAEAARNIAVKSSAYAATSRAPDSMPFGETYSWMKTFKMSSKVRAEHVAAMQAEIDKLTSAGHARWEHLPPGEVSIPSVGVFRVKMHDLHEGGRSLKARFCANGQKAESPSGGWESTAYVASYSQLLTVVALATQMDLKLAQIDVKSAFTQVKLKDDERIWVRPLPGLGCPNKSGKVLRLVHHLYGHPLANAAFQDLWVSVMKEYGFTVVDASETVFSLEKDGKRMLIATVVDDSLVAYSHEDMFLDLVEFLKSKFPITVSPVETICGMTVGRHADGSITVNQQEYIEKKAKAFGCAGGGRMVYTPMDSKFELGPRPEHVDKKLVAEARELMGSLIYATLTRPDCKFACSRLASIVTNPIADDITAMKRVMRYLYDTRTSCLRFRPGPWTGPNGAVHAPLELSVFVDASFAQEEGRKSQTGFVLMLAGAAIYAKSGKQSQVTDSTGYSETIALHESANWALVARRLLGKLFAPQPLPTKVYEDNEAATVFARKGPGPRSLHWDVKLQYVTELHNRGDIFVTKIDTKLQIADVLTKALAGDLHATLSAYMLGGPLVYS